MSDSLHFTHQHPAFHPGTTVIGVPEHDQFRKRHFNLCRAINMTQLSIVLQDMVSQGSLEPRMAELYHLQASSLLSIIISDHNRTFAEKNLG